MGEFIPEEQLRVVRYRSIHEVDELHWDSINSDTDLFHTLRFIQAVEDAKVENSEFWYLLFYNADNLIATAVLSAFIISLDLFVGGILGRFIRSIRRWFPHFLKLKVLFCGLPISLGQHNLVISDHSKSGEVLTHLSQEMSNICRQNDIQYMCVKEFLESQIEVMDKIIDHGFFRAHSIPYVSMSIRWPNFEAFLSQMRHNYRRPIKLTLKRIGQSQPEIIPVQSPSYVSKAPKLFLGRSEVCSPREFFGLYLQVMERAEVKLETLNRSFFENLYTNMKEDIEVLAMVKGEKAIGAAIITTHKKRMTFLLVGLDYAKRDEHEVYFNLIYGILFLAIQRGITQLDLGQTSYWLKQRIGGVCVPEYIYIKSDRWFIHHSLRVFRSLIFPELTLLKPRVFRTQ